MYQLVSKSDFHDAFINMGRGDQITYKARAALYDYLTDMEESEPGFELDVIALCCEWSEYESLDAFNADYGSGSDYESIEDIEAETQVIRIPNSESFLVLAF